MLVEWWGVFRGRYLPGSVQHTTKYRAKGTWGKAYDKNMVICKAGRNKIILATFTPKAFF